MMHTYHIHINGQVQGVGFRPFVCRIAMQLGVAGWVSNTNNGVHIECSASAVIAAEFYKKIISNPPANAIIAHHLFEEIDPALFSSFIIRQSDKKNKPDLLLTPDIALCDDCKQELLNPDNKRCHYTFTTCLNCGPRYSIITALPYDRERTTMRHLQMCGSCAAEYGNIKNRRHYSQTNTCKTCAIAMRLYSDTNTCVSNDADEIHNRVIAELQRGAIVAVKGMGGYLLLCDATREASIITLRTRKHRPTKPLALLYADVGMAAADVLLRTVELDALKDKSAPIVLCQLKPAATNGICIQAIARGLDKIGVMLPCTPLLFLIARSFNKPLVATSGNISGSPIIYKDEDALENLFEVADYVLVYDREIVSPQDDSVLQFTRGLQKIILRRGRGLAPNYFPNPFKPVSSAVLAMGSELKSAFALLDQKNLYISQYLGSQSTVESQTGFKETLQHVISLVKSVTAQMIIDKHPGYFVAQYGKEMAANKKIPIMQVQHHKAHFGAVLAENNLLDCKEPVLGFIWDGTGYGDDGQIWGGEVFIYEGCQMKRVAHLQYFSQLLADKMSREPRLSALSLLKNFPASQIILQKYFTTQEWPYYQRLLRQPAPLLTSSMGRFLDGIAAMLGICIYNSYEGQAAMQLETMARTCFLKTTNYYRIPFVNGRLVCDPFLKELLQDLQHEADPAFIAFKVFFSLAKLVGQLSDQLCIDKIAFSGGVFQNALLVDLLVEELNDRKQLFFHQQLSPNDECIGFGQLACYSTMRTEQKEMVPASAALHHKHASFGFDD